MAQGFTRRSLLAGAGGALGLGALAACGGNGSTTASQSTPPIATDKSDSEKVIRFANWTAYMDGNGESPDDAPFASLDIFSKQSGIKVEYSPKAVDDNETFVSKYRDQWSKGEDIGYDLVVLTEWMALRLKSEGLLQNFDKTIMPNLKNLNQDKSQSLDPENVYSVPWRSGYVGIAWNRDLLYELTGKLDLTSVDELWDPRLRNRVEVLTEMRDTMGLLLIDGGLTDFNVLKSDTKPWDTALATLSEQILKGQVRQARGNSYLSDLNNGVTVATMAWSGDIIRDGKASSDAVKNRKDGGSKGKFGFIVPKKGGMIFSDTCLVPAGSPHKKNVEKLLNYYYDPAVVAKMISKVQYRAPIAGLKEAFDALVASDSKQNVPLIPEIERELFPDANFMSKIHYFPDYGPEANKKFRDSFRAVLGM